MGQTSQTVDWEALKTDLEGVWRQMPRPFRTDRSIHGTLQCYLYRRLSDAGFQVIADYLPPRIPDRSVDLIALDQEQKIVYAVCLDTVITLYAVKSLTSFEAAEQDYPHYRSPGKKGAGESFFPQAGNCAYPSAHL